MSDIRCPTDETLSYVEKAARAFFSTHPELTGSPEAVITILNAVGQRASQSPGTKSCSDVILSFYAQGALSTMTPGSVVWGTTTVMEGLASYAIFPPLALEMEVEPKDHAVILDGVVDYYAAKKAWGHAQPSQCFETANTILPEGSLDIVVGELWSMAQKAERKSKVLEQFAAPTASHLIEVLEEPDRCLTPDQARVLHTSFVRGLGMIDERLVEPALSAYGRRSAAIKKGLAQRHRFQPSALNFGQGTSAELPSVLKAHIEAVSQAIVLES
jgi:hypothetical protein